MRKTFVLDTNVLLHDPESIFAFDEHDVLIPIYVLEEIDRFKRQETELGRSARKVSRSLDELRAEGLLNVGVELPNGGTLYVVYANRATGVDWSVGNDVDARIIAVALEAKAEFPGDETILVTKDINMRIRAEALGITAEDYEADKVDIDELYTGVCGYAVTSEELDYFNRVGNLPIPDGTFSHNEFVQLQVENTVSSTFGRYDASTGLVLPLRRPKGGMWGLSPRNKEQAFAIDLLMDDNIKLVTLVGKAGTGKTLCAIAAGLQKVMEERKYQRVLVSRPVMPLGKDIGYLPGDLREKLDPWMQPIYDNIEYLMTPSKAEKKRGRTHDELIDLGVLQIEPLTYIRGRSIPGQFMCLDESQQLSPHELRTVLTRVGEGTKIVLTGDPYQIDNPYLNASNNGLVHVVNRFRNEGIAGHITMQKGERSELAELSANLL